jgi:plastocyanin
VNTLKIASGLALTAGLALIAAVALVLVFPPAAPAPETLGEPTVTITIVGGETKEGFGFAIKGFEEIESPGPELRVRVGDVVKIVFENKGGIPHTFTILGDKREDAPVLFGASIGTASKPIQPEKTGSIVFKPNRAGVFYYGCVVPNHINLGMWGILRVEP